MNWFYAVGDQKNGPVSHEQLQELMAAGKINGNTLIWCEGMISWQPFSQVQSAGLFTVDRSASTCVECGGIFPRDELIEINHSPVCVGCKPVYLQKMAEGVPLKTSSTGNLWRSGKHIVTVDGTVFPDRCIKCNQPADGIHMKRKVYWTNPVYYLLFLLVVCSCFLVLVVLIVLVIIHKKATVQVGLCKQHQAARWQGMVIGWTCFALSIGVMICAGVYSSIGVGVAGFVLFCFSLIFGLMKGRVVAASEISKEHVWLKGAGQEFLDSLPDWRQP